MSVDAQEQLDTGSFFSEILTPGSSLNPKFLAFLDGAFVFLLLVLLGLAYATRGNLHIFGLVGIELALWASVKWFVNELQKIPPDSPSQDKDKDKTE
ncbi:hypothetical protein BDN72DRAFT_831546 [Pluteus cervinus]|uniref:Uncharacterized protein n=1 Tax=Pluteus cervinus TaxID=181527 RepID=A0ACD3BDU3_9AGAR|nr:hypothetical protein BDN72DRAFT_831546 [Pluteus cervinus]